MAVRQRKKKARGSVLRRLSLHVAWWCMVALTLWALWVDYSTGRRFAALNYALPATVYAAPLELYAGAPIAAVALRSELRALGFQSVRRVTRPGQYRHGDGVVEFFARDFDFVDGQETGQHVVASFSGQRVASIRTAGTGTELPILRLEAREIGRFHSAEFEDREVLGPEQIPELLVEALVAVEDRRYFSHFGLDPIGVVRALLSNLFAGEIRQGGSTLTQQLAKNLYLTRERTLWRKLNEAIMALSLERRYGKDVILTAYVNEVYLGQQGARAVHGFGAAARFYFRRRLTELDVADLALLAGLVKGPSYFNPRRHPERARARRDLVLAALRDAGHIDAATYTAASGRRLLPALTEPSGQRQAAFLDLVRRRLVRTYSRRDLERQGLRIFTTLNLAEQDIAERTLSRHVSRLRGASAADHGALNGAVVIVEAATGRLRALVGGVTSDDGGFNRAVDARRPIGSLVKPVVYLSALESGRYRADSLLSDAAVEMKMPDGSLWRPSNYDGRQLGTVRLDRALATSNNLATVRLGMDVGIERIARRFEALSGVRQARVYPSLLLGATAMSPLEAAGLYQALANLGLRQRLRAIIGVTDHEGRLLSRQAMKLQAVAEPGRIAELEQLMHGVMEHGTGRSAAGALRAALPLAGKTGTTDENRDSWFAGYGRRRVGVVWLGNDDNRPTRLTGASGALPVWTEIMRDIGIEARTGR
ncbi:MAG: penicillin-binding protein 1B [Gammaproteobacteria bacterium]|nr:penicillin-binding protein 1B [Gammaproteobacteria bacterium]